MPQIFKLLGVIRHKQAKESTTHSEQFLRTVLDSVTEAISIIDINDFRIVGANIAFLKQYGLTEAQAIGRKCYELTHRRNTPCEAPEVCPLHDVVKTRQHSVEEHIHYDEKGNEIYVEVCAYPILDDKGEVIQAVHLCRNITERKHAEDQLQRRIQELQALNNMFQKSLSVSSDTELAYISVANGISQLSREINNFSKKAQSQDINSQAALAAGIVGLADEISKLASQAEAVVSNINLPPAERL